MCRKLVLACLIVFSFAQESNADSGYFEVNQAMLSNNRFGPDEKLVTLEVRVEPKDYIKYEKVSKKLKFHQAPKAPSKSITCYFGGDKPMELGCELQPLSIGEYDYDYTYTLRMKAQKGNWYGLFGSDEGKTFWINTKESSGINFKVTSLTNWITSLAGFEVVNKKLGNEAYIYANPDTASNAIGQCGSLRPGGDGLEGMTLSGQIQGDFVEVFCESSDCYAEKSENHKFDEMMLDSVKIQIDSEKEMIAKGIIANKRFDKEEKEIRQIQAARDNWMSRKKCVAGWAQWRSGKGTILLSPKEGMAY